jgi:hypothetical protein
LKGGFGAWLRQEEEDEWRERGQGLREARDGVEGDVRKERRPR